MKKIFLLIFALALTVSAFAQKSNYTIQQYLNIKSASAPQFADKEGKRLFYLTNATGTSQIWLTDSAGAPKQITNYDDNVSFVSVAPDLSGAVFGKAVGGNENTQFFWMKTDGTGIKQLTNEPTIRHNFGDWSADGKAIYYASNKRDKTFFDLYRMDLATGKEELIYQQDGNNDFAAVSDDGKQIIISRDGTELGLDNNLYLIDAKTKQETLLTAHEGASQFGDAEFVGDNEIIFITNDKREFMTLATMFVKEKTIQISGENSPAAQWDLTDIETAPDKSMQARSTNREGFSEIEIFRRKDKSRTPIKLPAEGIAGGMRFSEDGGKLAFSFSSARNNSDVWVYDVKSKNLTQITKSDRAGIDQKSFVAPELIKFKSFDGKEIPAWFYRPEKKYPVDGGTLVSQSVGNLPVIISVHGGPEGQERPGFNPLYQYYLSRGYAVLATNVRGSTGYGKTFTHLDDVEKREDSVKDLAAAVEWLKTSGGADAKKIAVTGGSYGGYMTMAAITLYPDLFAAAVNTVGIVNWETFLKNTSGYRRRQREVEYGRLDRDLEFLKRISPIAKVDKIKTPLFVIHGKNDPRVPYTEAEQIVKVLKDKGAIVEYKLYDDEGHGISKLKNRLDLYPRVADFLDKYMK